MKKNLPSSLQNFNANTFFKGVLLLVAILFSSLASKASTDTIPSTLQSPKAFGGCIDTVFQFTYHSNHAHVLQIQCSLQNADTNCATSSGKPQLFIIADSSNISLANFKTDTLHGKLFCNIDSTNQTIYIRYKVFIDCSVLATGTNANLVQQFIDTTLFYAYNIDSSGSNTSIYTGLSFPKILAVSNNPFSSNYLETNYINLGYRNLNADATIKFRFYPGDTTFSGYSKTLGYEYKTDTMSNYVAFNPATAIDVKIPKDSFLYIRQLFTDTTCRDKNLQLTYTSTLQWQCNLPIPDTLFCSACLNNVVNSYVVQSNDNPKIIVKPLSPISNTTSDFSCFNDTVNMTSWSYLIVHDTLSFGAADEVSLSLGLHSSSISKSNLTIIPKSSVSIYKSNPLTTIDTTFYYGSTAPLCQNYIKDSMYAMLFKFDEFKHGDTIIINFKTFKCAAESDSFLLSKIKVFNFWDIYSGAKSICNRWQDPGALGVGSISYEIGFDQKLELTPTTNNLSVPHDSIYGDSLLLQVHLKGLQLFSYYYPIQYLGCDVYDSASSCIPHGLIRVRVNVGTGLHIPQPDSLVYFLIDTGIVPTKIYSQYYNTTIFPFDSCMKGAYYFYFPVTKQLLYALNYGNFECVIQACCGKPKNDEPVAAQIAFYLMPDPSDTCNNISFPSNHIDAPTYGNVNASYIPLSATGARMNVHCPGCKAPGVIADKYTIRRATYGLQDSDNDGIADSPPTQIDINSAWYAAHKKYLQPNTSSYGDQLQDFLIAHFQDGSDMTMDSSAGGYTYDMMKTRGAFLKYLQIAILIPDTQSGFGLTPTAFDFYIDERNSIAPDCKDCQVFQADTNYRTKVHIHVPQNLLTQFLVQDSSAFFYTFSSVDTSVYYLLNPTFLVHYDTINPLTTFEVDQRYRMTVSYDECKHFSAGAIPTMETARRSCEITVRNWLSGIPQSAYAFDLGMDMPNDTNLLDTVNWTFNQSFHPFDSLINQHFANSYIFYCEFNGTLHYFYSQDINFSPGITTTYEDCNYNMSIVTESTTAGALPSLHSYPYEYHPPSLFPASYKVKIPNGYTALQATIHNGVKVKGLCNGGPCPTKKITLPLPPIIGGYMTFDSLPALACFNESNISFDSLNAGAYMENDYTYRALNILIQPDSCNSLINNSADSTFSAFATRASIPCLQMSGCSDSVLIKYPYPYQFVNESKGNLQVSFTPINAVVSKHHLSWHVEVTNPYDTVDIINGQPFFTTLASHVFLQTPTTSFLNNWTFKNDDSTTTALPYSGQLFKLRNYLNVGEKITGTISCDYAPCIDSSMIPFITGYNCDGFPDSTFQVSDVCQAVIDSVSFKDGKSEITTDNIPNIPFSLCDDFNCSINFNLSNIGDVYTDSILISGLAVGINVSNVAIQNCVSGSLVSLTPSTTNHWLITKQNMHDAGFTDSLLVDNINQRCLNVVATFYADCSFESGFSNNKIILFGHNFCGNLLTDTAQGFNFIYSGNNCTQCYTITKTVDKDTAMVGDTLTYIITTCANNGILQSVIISDNTPPNFITIYNPTLPHYAALATGCVTDTLRGFFTQAGNCPATNNFALLDTNGTGTAFTSSVCNTILSSCYRTGYLIINDSTFSSSLPFSTYTNDTLIINGRFYIDNYFTLTYCHVITEPGANIIVLNNNLITLNYTDFEACTKMWRGIYLEESGDIEALGSRIFDAENGIWARQSNTMLITNCIIANCITGIRMQKPNSDSLSIYNYVSGSIIGTEIGKISTLKSPYNGQPYYGTFPFACVFMQNVIFNIGSTSYSMNNFHDANNGVVAVNTVSTISNTKFKKINETDTFPDYNINAAVAAQGANHTALCDVKVHPLYNPALTTIDSCYLSVYSKKSNIEVNAIRIKNTNLGVSVNSCNNLLKAEISSNYIEAKTRGIVFNNNNGSLHCTAEENQIFITNDKSKGIAVNESSSTNEGHYFVVNNTIKMDKATEGILLMNVDSAKVTGNSVVIINNRDTCRKGISIQNCNNALLTCNNIKGSKPKDTLSTGMAKQIGISVSTSEHSLIQCNTTDSTTWGFFFEGTCAATNFSKNEIYKHYEGIRLYSNAIIDAQSHRGNEFFGPFGSTFGAVNKNYSPIINLSFSQFVVDSNDGVFLLPKIPSYDGGWFVPFPGTTILCNQASDCSMSSFSSEISYGLKSKIAKDSVLSSEFIEESKQIAQEKLFNDLTVDNTKYSNDATLNAFVNDNKNEALGYMSNFDKSISKYTNNDSITTGNLNTVNVEINNLLQSIHFNDSIQNYTNRNSVIDSLNVAITLRNNYLLNARNNDASHLADAISYNVSIVPRGLLDENKIAVNDAIIDFEKYGEAGILQHEESLLDIAHQCPHSGGVAVYIARAILESKYDTLFYDDATQCALQGFYRMSLNQQSKSTSNNLIVTPNPASTSIKIMFSNNELMKGEILIINSVNQIVLKSTMKNQAFKEINITSLSNGVYTIIALSENQKTYISKLVIIK